MKLIRKRDLVNHLYEYINGEMTIGECVDNCHTYNVDEDRICEICNTPGRCEGCPLRKEKSE